MNAKGIISTLLDQGIISTCFSQHIKHNIKTYLLSKDKSLYGETFISPFHNLEAVLMETFSFSDIVFKGNFFKFLHDIWKHIRKHLDTCFKFFH